MQTKIMNVFYGNDCLPYKDQERAVHYPIVGSSFEGASQTTEIRFYIDEIGGKDATWVAVAKLPNGEIGSKILSTYQGTNGEYYAKLVLDTFFTQYKGDVYVSLQGYDGGVELNYDEETEIYTIVGTPVIQATGSVKLAINYAPQIVDGDEQEGITVQEALAVVATKLGKDSGKYLKVVTNISQINSSTYAGYLGNNDIVYSIEDKTFYKLTGTHPTLSYAEINLDVDVLNAGEIYAGIISVNSFNNVVDGTDQSLTSYIENKVNTEISSNAVDLTTDQTIGGNKTFVDDATFKSNVEIDGYITDGIKSLAVSQIEDNRNKVTSIGSSSTNTQYPSALAVWSLVDSIKKDSLQIADYETYPTLEDWLDNFEGEEGIIYLYPVNTNEAPTFSSGFYRYVLENDAWLPLGTTTVDLSDYATKSYVSTQLLDYVPTSRTIAGINLASNITAQALTDALVFATDNDIENIMEN